MEIYIYTDNLGFVGDNILRMRSYLTSYPHVVGYSQFLVKIYRVVLPAKIGVKYYQIGKPEQVFTFNEFTIEPALPEFTIVYKLQVIDDKGITQFPTPDWVTLDTTKMSVSVVTKDFSLEGNWTICILGRPTDGISEFGLFSNLSFTQVLSKSAPPITVLIPPYFVSPLVE